MKNRHLYIDPLTQLVTEIKSELPSNDIENIVDLIENNEYGVAYEILCVQLHEYNIKISFEFYEKIANYGISINIPPSIWLPLKELHSIKK